MKMSLSVWDLIPPKSCRKTKHIWVTLKYTSFNVYKLYVIINWIEMTTEVNNVIPCKTRTKKKNKQKTNLGVTDFWKLHFESYIMRAQSLQ